MTNTTLKFRIEKIANMIFISTEDTVWKAWNIEDFTERKLQNAIKKFKANYTWGEVEFERMF